MEGKSVFQEQRDLLIYRKVNAHEIQLKQVVSQLVWMDIPQRPNLHFKTSYLGAMLFVLSFLHIAGGK